jgi:hypothetical protein
MMKKIYIDGIFEESKKPSFQLSPLEDKLAAVGLPGWRLNRGRIAKMASRITPILSSASLNIASYGKLKLSWVGR